MTFYVGQKVVCVDNSDREFIHGSESVACWLMVGTVYTVRRTMHRHRKLVWLAGINRRRTRNGIDWADSGFFADRFRPLTERKSSTETGMSILREIVQRETVDVPSKVKA